jgi:sigma-B regulation protein RsbU (phosphoserine phosphatase)
MPETGRQEMKILIAEDDPASGRLLSSSLKKLGYDVILAPNGRDAWYSFLSERPRIVVTDWMMPIVDGIELCSKIRAEGRPQYTYVILLTALSGKDRFMEGMRAGADDFITKPFDLEALRVRLRVAERILGLQQRVTTLKGLLPICSYCRRIRDDEGKWHGLEEYVMSRTEAAFAHTLCPECATPLAGVTEGRKEQESS